MAWKGTEPRGMTGPSGRGRWSGAGLPLASAGPFADFGSEFVIVRFEEFTDLSESVR